MDAAIQLDVQHDIEPSMEEYTRLPGLYQRCELEQVLELGEEYRLEDGGRTETGARLLQIYKRSRNRSMRGGRQ